jgi:hypothetical protein
MAGTEHEICEDGRADVFRIEQEALADDVLDQPGLRFIDAEKPGLDDQPLTIDLLQVGAELLQSLLDFGRQGIGPDTLVVFPEFLPTSRRQLSI